MTPTTQAIQVATAFASADVPCFPIAITWDAEKQKTNKRPLTSKGFLDATTDPALLARMFDRHLPESSVLAVGLHPGPAGYVIVDLDVNETVDGYTCWQDLCALYGDPGDVPTVLTASGGRHLWFRKPEGKEYGNAHDLGAGIDVRADAGYVVAPGTQTPWGSWEWDGNGIGTTIPPVIPTWTAQRLHNSTGSGAPAERNIALDDVDPADRASIEALMQLGGHGLYRKPVTRGDGSSTICYYLTRPGKSGGTSATIGYIGPGIAKIWTPSWPSLREGKVYDPDELALIANPGEIYKPDAIEVAGSPALDPGTQEAALQWERDTRALVKDDTRSKFLTGAAVLDLPPPDPMVGNWIDRGVIASMPAKFGAGKSFLLLDMALSVASGVSWMGQSIHHTGPVWFVMAEGAYTASDRVKAWGIRHGQPIPEDFMLYPHRFDLTDPASWVGLRWLMEDSVDDGMELPALIILDTYSQLTSGDEKPETTKAALNAMYDMRDMSGAAVVIAHHTGHNVSGRGRGDSTLEDSLDVVLPIEGRLRDDNGQPVPAALCNTKQKSRATQAPIWYQLKTLADEDGLPLPYVETTAQPSPDGGDGMQAVLFKLWEFIDRHDGEHTARDLERGLATGSSAIGARPQRAQAIAIMEKHGCIVVRREGQKEVLCSGIHPRQLAVENL